MSNSLSSIARWTGVQFRQFVLLLLGGILAVPYLGIGAAFVQIADAARNQALPVAILLVLTIALGAIPPLLATVRSLEIAAVRGLLGVPLPDPPDHRVGLSTRLRAALWFVLHLLAGSGTGVAILLGVPVGILLFSRGVGGAAVSVVPALDFLQGGAALLAAIVIAALIAVVVIGLGAALRWLAPLLLGPGQEERILELELERKRTAERNRIARELHDSIGHALTVTTLQSAAARRVLHDDPAFAEAALATIEDTGRAATAELDGFLAMLRDDRATPRAGTLAELSVLVSEAQAAGARVQVRSIGDLAGLPPAVSREAFGIVRESITNAMKHGGDPITVAIERADAAVDIVVRNPVPHRSRSSRSGHGLDNMRERAALLGGDVTAGRTASGWQVTASLPLGRAEA